MADDSATERTLGCLLLLISIPISISLRGYVLVQLWTWFIVPQFDLAPLSITSALGIATIAKFLTNQDIDIQSPERTFGERVARSVMALFAGPLISLLFGWLILKFW